MSLETTFIYTDASFNKRHSIAVIGFIQFKGLEAHKDMTSDMDYHLEVISEANNVRAELRSAIEGLKACAKSTKVVLYSDCHGVTGLAQRREKLEQQNFISQSKGTALSNTDLYKEFYTLSDQFNLQVHWLKGHSANRKLDKIQETFSHLDKQIRKKLRARISKLEEKQNEKNILL